MSSNISQPAFLNTDILRQLGRDGFIIMIVAVFLLGVLTICLIALIVWYCRKGEQKSQNYDSFDDVLEPELGIKKPPGAGVSLPERQRGGLEILRSTA